jgi:hypothetical protein
MANVEVHNFKQNDIDLNLLGENGSVSRITVPAGRMAPGEDGEKFQPGVAEVDEGLLNKARKNSLAVEGLFSERTLRVLKKKATDSTPAPAATVETPPAAPAAPAAPEAPAAQ